MNEKKNNPEAGNASDKPASVRASMRRDYKVQRSAALDIAVAVISFAAAILIWIYSAPV